MPAKALMVGSFDPITVGHEDAVRRAAEIFDCVTVAVCVNSEKNPMFSAAERLRMLKAGLGGIENVRTDICEGLVADYAEKKGIKVLIKGIRNSADASYELMLADVNGALAPGLETLMLPSRSELVNVSSTVVREMLRYGRGISRYVSPAVEKIIYEIYNKR